MDENGSFLLDARPRHDAPKTDEQIQGTGRQQITGSVADEQGAAAFPCH